MRHGGDTYQKNYIYDFSVSLNPFAPVRELIEAGAEGLADSDRYPDPEQRKIRTVIGDAEKVPADCVLAGNGASELLTGVVRYVNPKSAVLFVPGYSGYDYVLNLQEHCEVIRYRTKEEEGFLPTARDFEKIPEEWMKPEIIFLCNPWNPTGKLFDEKTLKELLMIADREGIYVVLDESFTLLSDRYLNYELQEGKTSDQTNRTTDAGRLIKQYPKIIILKSYTKFLALPGVRMGYLLGNEEIICGIKKELPEWNLSVPAEYILEKGIVFSKDAEYLSSLASHLKEEREYLIRELTEAGMKVFESNSCFLYFKAEKEIADVLSEKGILIRTYDPAEYPKGYYYRIGVKDHEANKYLAESIKSVVNK